MVNNQKGLENDLWSWLSAADRERVDANIKQRGKA
jgi:hypothetical protein